jgi:predicted dehydrogenase
MHRILIIGVGSIGERHLRCFKNTGRASVGLCELNPQLMADVARKYEVKDVFASLDEALKSKWDAAVVASPAFTHVPVAQKLAEAGINLFIEKPLSTTAEGIDKLVETIRSRKLLARVAYTYRSHPALAAMREAIRSGKYGKPAHVVVISGQHFPFFRPAYRNIYFTDRKKGGGAIQDSLTHQLNAVEWLAGPIERLACDASHQVLDGITVEDTVNLIARHAGNVMASFAHNMFQMQNETSITVLCERGTLRWMLQEHRLRIVSEVNGPWQDQDFGPMERDDWFTRQENLFLDALEQRSDNDVLCTVEEARQTLRVNLAALRSADGGGQMLAVKD